MAKVPGRLPVDHESGPRVEPDQSVEFAEADPGHQGRGALTADGVDHNVHAAGSRITASGVTEAGLDEFDALVRINTRATFVVNREAARHLRDGGAIVNLSSSAGGASLRTHGLYAATKAPTYVLTRALALELRERDITVNTVTLEVHRPCAPNQVADVIAYLLSEHGHGLTGQVFRVGDPGLRP